MKRKILKTILMKILTILTIPLMAAQSMRKGYLLLLQLNCWAAEGR